MSEVTLRAPQNALSEAMWHNPFVPISDAMRLVVVTYFVFWRLVPILAVLFAQATVDFGYAVMVALTRVATEALLLLPFLLKRFAGTPIGWLHPLVLPTAVSILFGVLRRPDSLWLPYTAWFQTQAVPFHELLVGWPELMILEAQLKLNVINLMALVFVYAGFSIVLSRHQDRERRPIRINGMRIAILFVLMLLIVLAFLQMQGGITQHMSVLSGGRFRMRALSGHFLVVNAFLPILLILWYANNPSATRNPLFIVAFALVAVLQFVVTGSRSGIFEPLAMLLAIWMYHNGRIPATRAVLLGLVAVMLIGVLGEVRRSGRDGEIDLTPMTEFDLESAWGASQEEQANRSRGTALAVVALVPERHGYLLGETYMSVVAFWVPRSIWHDKPRGAGAYVAALLYQGRESMDGYAGAGYPVGSQPEAYWNFGYPGVILIHLIFGILLGFLARWLQHSPKNPFVLIAFIMVLFDASSPDSRGLTLASQRLALLYFSYLFLTRLAIRR